MEFKGKNRDEVSRLVSDRQAYISSLELKLEKFTQNIKEKFEKLSSTVSMSEEKIQGLSWLIKQQNEVHQQQVKSLSTRYEDLCTQISTLTLSQNYSVSKGPVSISKQFSNLKPEIQDFSKIFKEIEEIIALSSSQVKNEVDQRLDIMASKSNSVYKILEQKIEGINIAEARLKSEFTEELNTLLLKNQEMLKEFKNKFDTSQNINTERYKEISLKLASNSSFAVIDEINALKQRIQRFDEFKHIFEESEIRRELEVKEASQSAWSVENQLKILEKQLSNYNGLFQELKDLQLNAEKMHIPFEEKLNNLSVNFQKYLTIQKTLHKRVDILTEIVRKFNKVALKTKERSTSLKSKRSTNGENSCSLSMNSSRRSILKPSPTPRVRSSKPALPQKGRIDILYDELSNMFV